MYTKTGITPKTQKSAEAALKSLQRTCSRMERSKSDARKYLVRHEIRGREAETIICRLEEDGYIDERRYAGSFVREKINLQKWSRRRIVQALTLKGIPVEYIDEAIEENFHEEKETDNLCKILGAKLKKLESGTAQDDEYTLRRKLFSYAAGKGYDFDDINDIIDTIMKR